jgi:hypothetical protein
MESLRSPGHDMDRPARDQNLFKFVSDRLYERLTSDGGVLIDDLYSAHEQEITERVQILPHREAQARHCEAGKAEQEKGMLRGFRFAARKLAPGKSEKLHPRDSRARGRGKGSPR